MRALGPARNEYVLQTVAAQSWPGLDANTTKQISMELRGGSQAHLALCNPVQPVEQHNTSRDCIPLTDNCSAPSSAHIAHA